jgi:hypothetical protein
MATVGARPDKPSYSLAGFLGYFLRLGSLGFGGPIALAGYMQRDLLERRGWIDKADYDEGLQRHGFGSRFERACRPSARPPCDSLLQSRPADRS